MRTRSPSAISGRGFTLVELLAVVAITGILAMVGVTVFRHYVTSAKGGEALSTIQAIRSAEEAYIAENHVYMDASTGTNWYPNLTPNSRRYDWTVAGHPDFVKWQALAPAVNRPVQFGYLANAGLAGTPVATLQNLLQTAKKPTFAVPTTDWYMIQAEGDVDGDGVFARYASTSMTGEIYTENEGQ